MIFKGSPKSLTESYFTDELRLGVFFVYILFYLTFIKFEKNNQNAYCWASA